MNIKRLLWVLPLCALAIPAFAGPSPDKDKTATVTPPKAQQSVSYGSVEVEGHRIKYKAVAGTLILKDKKGKPTASMFYVAYFKEGAKDAAKRPLTFFYNGGPGSSTVWLHMGAFGPKRVVTADHTHTKPAPYSLVNNDYSLLDATDEVFVDAVGTGYSKVIGKDEGGAGTPKMFWGVDEDSDSFAQFIPRFLAQYGRWNSPKYLFGESYGTTRSASLSYDLISKDNIDLNGVVLLSAILDFTNGNDDDPQLYPGEDLAYELSLPTYAATAWYHKKLPDQPKELEPFLKQVEHFALNDYAHALSAGADLDAATRDKVAEELHEYTGLPVQYVKDANLRINGGMFEKELLRDSDEDTGRLDTRFTGPSLDPLGKEVDYDAQAQAISSAYVSLFNDYVRSDLKFDSDDLYKPEIGAAYEQWDRIHHAPSGAEQTYGVNVMPDLAAAMSLNPDMKVMLNSGYYDLATPFFSAVYQMKHLPMDPKLQKNISYEFYQSGHMVYAHLPALKHIHDATAKFIESTH